MRIWMVASSTAMVSTLMLLGGASCGEEVSGDKVHYSLVASGAVAQGELTRFTNARGWQIELTRAQALLGPIYLYSGEARAQWVNPLVREAHACAAHSQFQSGLTLGETTYQYGVDLLGGPTTLEEDIEGVAGEVRSVELHVQNPGQVEAGNAMAQATPSTTYVFEGNASKGGVTIPFSVEITLPENGTHQIIDSIPAQMDLRDGSQLHLKVQLDRLFRDVSFEEKGAGERFKIEPGTQAYSSLVFSLRARSAFVWQEAL